MRLADLDELAAAHDVPRADVMRAALAAGLEIPSARALVVDTLNRLARPDGGSQ